MPFDDTATSPRKGKLAETIAETIKQDILDRGWPVGEILGNEPQLQERYGVSRATIREAIRQLERHGVASMRRGKLGGLVVEQPAQVSAVLALATYLELANITFEELFEARNVIECMSLEQVGKRLPDSELAHMQAFIDALRQPELLTFADEMVLHTQIRNFLRDMAKNPATAIILDALYYVTIQDLPPRASKKDVEQTLNNARRIRLQILEALVGGDPDSAKHWQRELLEVGEWLVRKQLSGSRSKNQTGTVRLSSSPDSPLHEIFNKTAQKLALQIIQAIKKKKLQPGDRLGTEPELQEEYDVSRAVLREALRILELHSIVISKRGYGGGLVVSKPQPDYTVNIVASYLHYYDFSPHYFFEVWGAIQLATVKMAAERITEDKGQYLLKLLEAEKNAAPKDYMKAVRALEKGLTDICGNRPLALFAQVLLRMGGSYTKGAPTKIGMQELTAEHENIVKAVIAGEAGIARRAMSHYLDLIGQVYGGSSAGKKARK